MDLVNPKRDYYRDENTVYSCQYHIIFTPKYRRKVLTDEIGERFKELVYEKQEEFEYGIIEMEAMEDHVHLLIEAHPNRNIKDLVGKIKGYTSSVLKKEFKTLKSRLPTLWTRSCFISTVGSVSLEVVKTYIENQKHV
jgi:putative transposase